MERQISLTQREWTLIRVALLQRLAHLQKRIVEERASGSLDNVKFLQASFDDSKALLNGKLTIWK